MNKGSRPQKILEFRSLENDKVALDLTDPLGITILVIPEGNTEEDGVVDIFRVGLRQSSVKKMLRSMRYGDKYFTKDHNTSIWKDKSDKLQFTFKLHHAPDSYYLCELDKETSNDLLSRLGEYLTK